MTCHQKMTCSAIIYSTASGDELPKDLFMDNSTVSRVTTELRTKLLLEKALSVYSIDQLFEYSVHASGSSSGSTQHLLSAAFGGVLLMMKNLLGDDFESLRERIMQTLDSVDSYGSSILTLEMFQDFMQLMMQSFSSQNSIATRRDSDSTDVKRFSIGSANNMISNGMFGINKYLTLKYRAAPLFCAREVSKSHVIFRLPIQRSKVSSAQEVIKCQSLVGQRLLL